MEDVICGVIIFVTVGLVLIAAGIVGAEIKENTIVNKLCNQTQYDFCVPKTEFRLKDKK